VDLQALMDGFKSILTSPSAILWCLLGITIGTLVGALPGVGPTTGIAILLPLTFGLNPLDALILMMSVYNGAMYGGRISSILINVPGDAAAVVSTFDGYPLAQQGKAGYALTLSAVASFIGGTLGFVGLAFLSPTIARGALVFGPPEYFTLMLFALIATSGLAEKRPFKAIVSTLLGLMIALIGMDSVTGEPRLTFGLLELWDGIDFVVVAIGVFGMSEVLLRLETGSAMQEIAAKLPFKSLFPNIKEIVSNFSAIARGSLIGFFVGVLPGAGATIATFLAYSAEKKVSRNPERFGMGVPQGLSAPEAANNASVGGALIPTFSLGIPGSGTTAILLGGLMMVGLKPGPLMFQESGDVIWAAIAGFCVANILLLILNTVFVPFFAIAIQKADPYMAPLIAVLCSLGVYMMNNSLFDIGLMIFFGFVGYFMRKCQFPIAPLILGLILAPMIEKSMRQALSMSGNDYSIFVMRPISLVFLVLSIILLFLPIIKKLYNRNPEIKINQ